MLWACLAGIIQQSEGDRSLLRKDFVSFIQPVFQALYDKKEEILLLNRADLGSILLDVLKDYFGFDDGGTDAGEVNYPDPKGSKLAVKEYRGSSD